MKNQREKGKSFKSEKELKINFQAFPYSENQREKALAFPLSTSGDKTADNDGAGCLPSPFAC